MLSLATRSTGDEASALPPDTIIRNRNPSCRQPWSKRIPAPRSIRHLVMRAPQTQVDDPAGSAFRWACPCSGRFRSTGFQIMVKRSGQEPPKPGPEQKDRDEAGRAAQPQVDGTAQLGLALTASGTWLLARVNDQSLAPPAGAAQPGSAAALRAARTGPVRRRDARAC